jgi:POLQ-like helicase
MPPFSRRRAQSWPYPRHAEFEKHLQVSNRDWFAARRHAVHQRMPYMLAKWEDWPKNIIVPAVADAIKAERIDRHENRIGFPLHKYIHHGLSSQAMLFNLVGPLLASCDLSPLKHAFTRAGISWPDGPMNSQLELEDRTLFNEDSGQPTSIDLALQGPDGSRGLYVEAKLVEREFGGCSVFQKGDCSGRSPVGNLERCYLHYLGRHYWTLLEKHGFLHGPLADSPICPLALYYQFFRELLFAVEKGGDFVLLHDQRNPVFYGPDERGLMPFLLTFVPQKLQTRVHAVTIQQVVAGYAECGGMDWLGAFEEKYGMQGVEKH